MINYKFYVFLLKRKLFKNFFVGISICIIMRGLSFIKLHSNAFLIRKFSLILSDACSSRIISRPKPRTTVAPTSSPRPNITFHTYKCPEAYATWYCLNGATCFAVKIGVEVLYNCECKDGYIGPRCDYKNLDGSYLSKFKRKTFKKKVY